MTVEYPVCQVETNVFLISKVNRMPDGRPEHLFVIDMDENKVFNGGRENPYDFQWCKGKAPGI